MGAVAYLAIFVEHDYTFLARLWGLSVAVAEKLALETTKIYDDVRSDNNYSLSKINNWSCDVLLLQCLAAASVRNNYAHLYKKLPFSNIIINNALIGGYVSVFRWAMIKSKPFITVRTESACVCLAICKNESSVIDNFGMMIKHMSSEAKSDLLRYLLITLMCTSKRSCSDYICPLYTAPPFMENRTVVWRRNTALMRKILANSAAASTRPSTSELKPLCGTSRREAYGSMRSLNAWDAEEDQ
jgi:hypothetical protein